MTKLQRCKRDVRELENLVPCDLTSLHDATRELACPVARDGADYEDEDDLKRKQSIVWSFTMPTACIKA
jgi:hypothetical protein